MTEKINFPSEKINDSTEKIVDSSEQMDSDTEKMTEKNEFPSEKINDSTEKIVDSSEQMDSDTEKIEVSTEKIPEIIPEITRYRGQRGPDKAPRTINPNSLRNLKPFQNLPEKDNLIITHDDSISEEKKPVWKKPIFWLGISGTIIAFSILALKLYEALNKSRQEDSEEEIDEV